MTRRVVSKRIVVSLCAALLLLLTSCDARKNADGQSGSSQPLSSAACLDAQREAFPPLVGAWRKMAIAVTTANNAASPVTLQPWTGALEKVRSQTAREGCPNPPQELEPLTALTADVEKTGGQITLEQIRGLGVLLRELHKKLQVLPSRLRQASSRSATELRRDQQVCECNVFVAKPYNACRARCVGCRVNTKQERPGRLRGGGWTISG